MKFKQILTFTLLALVLMTSSLQAQKTVTVRWFPYASEGMTLDETRDQLIWAMDSYSAVCGLNMVGIDNRFGADITLTSSNTLTPYYQSSNRTIYMPRKHRDWSGRDGHILGGIMLHELGHPFKIGLVHTPLTDEYRHYIMHPWVSNVDWFAPEEIKRLQALHGLPNKEFIVHPIWYAGKLIRDSQRKLASLQFERQNWADARDGSIWTVQRLYCHSQVIRINAEIKPVLQQITSRSKVWNDRVNFWRAANVPKAFIPNN